MAKYIVKLKDNENQQLLLEIGENGLTDITGDKFTAKFAPQEIKHSMDAIMSFTGMLEQFNLSSIEIERVKV